MSIRVGTGSRGLLFYQVLNFSSEFARDENLYYEKEQLRLKHSYKYIKALEKKAKEGDSRGTYLLSKRQDI